MRRRTFVAGAAASALPVPSLAAPAQPGQSVSWPQVRLLDGRTWSAEQARGQAVVVVFWATTCPFCLRHNAHIEKLRRALPGKPVQILTAARDRDPAVVRSYLERNNYGFAVTLDHAPLAQALSARNVIPLSVLVDRSGRLRQVIAGEMFEEDVMEWRDLS
jgi:thiol-disulfide isomerase/thioredoxin